MAFIDVLVTCPDETTAEKIGRACVEDRLAGCANILGGVTSIYRWLGAVEQEREHLLLLKTRAGLFERLAARVKALHPYETPAIVALQVAAVEKGYADWLLSVTEEG